MTTARREGGAERQTDRKRLRRLKASNEVINVGAMGVPTGTAVVVEEMVPDLARVPGVSVRAPGG